MLVEVKIQTPSLKMEKLLIESPSIDEALSEARTFGNIVSYRRKNSLSSLSGPRLSIGERQALLRQLAVMVNARVSLGTALRLIESSSFGVNVKRTAKLLRRHVEQGLSLGKAMSKVGETAFSGSITALVQNSSQGGSTAQALIDAADFELELNETKRQSSGSIIVGLGSILFSAICAWGTVKEFAPWFLNNEMMKMFDISKLDNIMFWSEAFTWIIVMISIAILLLIVVSVFVRPFLPVATDKFILKIPFYKDIVLAQENYITMFGLAKLIGSGIGYQQSFQLAEKSAQKGKMKMDLGRAADNIKRGLPWATALSSLHNTDQAALQHAMNREQVSETISMIAIQYRQLYLNRVRMLDPVLKTIAAVSLIITTFVVFAISVIPVLEITKQAMQGGLS